MSSDENDTVVVMGGLPTIRNVGRIGCVHTTAGILIAEPSLLPRNCHRMIENSNNFIE
jgi:hypothetical protein